LLDQVPALYAAERIPTLLEQHPGLRHVAVPGVNHYTIVLSERGADAVARVVRAGPVASSPSASARISVRRPGRATSAGARGRGGGACVCARDAGRVRGGTRPP